MYDYEDIFDAYDREMFEPEPEADEERGEELPYWDVQLYCPSCTTTRTPNDDAFQDYERNVWVCDPCGATVAPMRNAGA